MSHATYACCHEGCAHVICFTPDVERRLQDTHEWWKCPAGHSQHFSGKSEKERRIANLESEVLTLRRALRGRLGIIRRLSKPTCWCGATFKTQAQLRGHKTGAGHWDCEGER